VGSSSEAFARFIEKDAAQWAAVVKKGNIVLD
jgi:tripartite-type tricarboxylate transporter receptor subunit TctC